VGGVGIGGNLHVSGIIYGAILGTATTATNADNIKTVLQTSSSSHYLAFVDANNSTATYEALYTTSSFVINPQSGNIGFGNVSPTWKVDVNLGSITSPSISTGGYNVTGDATSSVGYTTYNLQLNNSTANASGYMRLARTGGTAYLGMQIGSQSRDGIAFLTSATTPTESMRITAAGNVGIGFTSPNGKLDVAGDLHVGATQNTARFKSDNTNTFVDAIPALGAVVIRAGGSVEKLRVTANGGISFGASGTAYGVSGQLLQSNGDAAPTWISTGSLVAANATTATHLLGGTPGQVPYQTAAGVTSFYGPGTAGNVLVSNGTSAPSYNNTLTLAGTTAATSTTTGTLVVVGGVGIGDNLFVNNNINAVNGQFVSTRANNTTTGAGQIYLNGATGNRIDFNVNGVAAPAFTTRSAGTKLVLYPNVSGSAADYAIGIDSSTLWNSVPNTSSFFRWYGGTTLAATLTGAGNLTLVGDLAVNGGDITTTQATFNLINTTATTVNFAGSATTLTMGASGSGTTNVRNNLTVSGNLTVQGTTTIVDSTVTNIADPIITLGGGTGNTAPTADDNKDRGVAFKWVNNAGTTSTGFFGYDDSTGYLTYVQTATITNEVVSGTKGAIDVNLAGGTAMSVVYQSSPNNTAFLAASTSGYLLQTNGTGSAPSWVSAGGVSAGSATYADNVRTIAQTANASYFPTFVDSNNASNAYESVYTTSSFVINPQSGNIGIGVSSPAQLVDAYKTANADVAIQVSNDNAGTSATAQFFASNGSTKTQFFHTGGSYSGVGVLASAPGLGGIYNTTAQGLALISAHASGVIKFATGSSNTERVRIDSSGNVNIGTFTTSISKKFTVVGEGNFSDASNTARLYMGFGTIPTTGGTGAYIYNNDNSPLAFGTTNTERMRIDTLGTVGIGETSPTTYATTGSLVITNTTFRPEIALRTTTAIGGTTAIKLGATSSIPQGGAVISSYISAVSGQPTDLIFSLVTSGVLTERLRITSNGGIAFSGTNTYGTSGFVLKSNGDAAPTWVNPSTLASASATNADNIRTVAQTANASYFPAFVDSNNASNAYELVYTTSTFSINPATGFVGIGGTNDSASPLNVKALSTLSGTINSFQKVLTTQASGGLGNNVYRTEWRRRRAAGTDWQTQNIHDGIWVDSSFTTPMTDTRTWWDRDPNTTSQAWGDQATTWMFHNSSALFLTGGSSQLNTGFTNRLNVTGSIVAGSASSTSGSIILQGQYGTGSITNLGTEYSSGGPVLGYGVYPSNTATGAFFSSSGLALTRGAYTIAGNVHNWYVGASQTLAIGSTATLSLAMTLNSAGALAFNGASNYGSSGQILQSNGNAAPTWIALSSRTVGTSTQVNTVLQTASASYFPTFVDSNNASATAESFYTTSSFSINPGTGLVTVAAPAGGDGVPSLRITQGTAPSTFNWISSFLNSSLTAGKNAINLIGQAESGNNSAYFGFKYVGASSASNFATIGLYGADNLLNILANGNVGIGTTNPPNKLTVSNGGAVGLEISPTGGYTALGGVDLLAYNRSTSAYAPIGFITNSSNNSMVILTNGNVGIGTTAPNDKLQVQTSSATAYDATSDTGQYGSGAGITVTNMDETSQSFAQINLQVSGNSGRAVGRIVAIRTASATSDLAFVTENANTKAEKMRISSAGNVSIGTTSTTNKFEVAGTAGQLFSVSDSFTGTIFSVNDVSGIPSIEVLDTGLVKFAQYGGQVAINTGTVASSTASLSVYGMIYTMGTLGEIRASSEITAYYSSDSRLKENIKLIENPITIIDQIRGVTFDWTDEHMARRGGEDGYFVRKHDIGVIAQEVQAVLPELVGTREDGYLAVKYEKMVPLLIEAIKAQQKTIDSLVKDLADVKEFIGQLKNKNGI
jgi:hypothetical protein